jgi:hypothetical protein
VWQRLHFPQRSRYIPRVGQIVLENVSEEFGQGVRSVDDDVSLTSGVGIRPEPFEDAAFAPTNLPTAAKVGKQLRLALDPSRLYYFSPETGESLLADRH